MMHPLIFVGAGIFLINLFLLLLPPIVTLRILYSREGGALTALCR